MLKDSVRSGRGSSEKSEVRGLNRTNRYQARRFLQAVQLEEIGWRIFDEDGWEEDAAIFGADAVSRTKEPEKPKCYKGIGLQGRPVLRWLKSQVGRLWAEVYSLLATMFRANTFVGAWVRRFYGRSLVDTTKFLQEWGTKGFFVDEAGILRYKERAKKVKTPGGSRYGEVTWLDVKTALAECGGRIPGHVGARLYWFDRTSGRQMQELNTSERAWFEGLRLSIQHELTDASPVSESARFRRAHFHSLDSVRRGYAQRVGGKLKLTCAHCGINA